MYIINSSFWFSYNQFDRCNYFDTCGPISLCWDTSLIIKAQVLYQSEGLAFSCQPTSIPYCCRSFFSLSELVGLLAVYSLPKFPSFLYSRNSSCTSTLNWSHRTGNFLEGESWERFISLHYVRGILDAVCSFCLVSIMITFDIWHKMLLLPLFVDFWWHPKLPGGHEEPLQSPLHWRIY